MRGYFLPALIRDEGCRLAARPCGLRARPAQGCPRRARYRVRHGLGFDRPVAPQRAAHHRRKRREHGRGDALARAGRIALAEQQRRPQRRPARKRQCGDRVFGFTLDARVERPRARIRADRRDPEKMPRAGLRSEPRSVDHVSEIHAPERLAAAGLGERGAEAADTWSTANREACAPSASNTAIVISSFGCACGTGRRASTRTSR
jgi:hypothetical protein